MKISGKDLQDYLRLLAPLFGLIAAVWALRLVMDAIGAPFALVRACSVTVTASVSVLLAAALVHFKQFGSYANLVAAVFLLTFWEQFLISSAIAFSMLTRIQNVYIAPEFALGFTPLRHIAGHLLFGVGFGTLFGSAVGCLLLWLLRKFVPAVPKGSTL